MGNTDIYFVLTCGDSIGNAGKYLGKAVCRKKDELLRLRRDYDA